MFRTPFLASALALALFATPVFAADAESNKQAPAPQGTEAPASNEKANSGASTGTSGTSEQMKTQSPGMSEDTDLSKSSKSGAGTGTSNNREATNPESPAPNNTVKPQ